MKRFFKFFRNQTKVKVFFGLAKILLVVLMVILVSISQNNSSLTYYISAISTPPSEAVATDWAPPPIPTLLFPSDNSFLNATGFTLDWTDETDNLSNPVYYLYQSANDSGFGIGSIVSESSLLGSSNFIDINVIFDGEYWWRVKACDQLNNCSDWSGAWKLTVDTTSPSVPGQIGWTTMDFDNYRTCGEALNYSPMSNLWEPSTDINSIVYEREVYTPTDSVLVYSSTLSNNYENGGGAVDGMTYWVRVRAKDVAGNYSDWTTKCPITYDTTAPVISDLGHLVATPENTNDTKATITWTTDENANSVLYWSTDGITWDLPVSDSGNVTSHSLEITGLSTLTTYYYYVTSADPAGNMTTLGTNIFNTNDMTSETFTPTSDIVINEFLIDPIGADNALMTGGEWVELYNNSTTTTYDLTGWSLNADNTPAYRLVLTTANTVSSDLSTTGLTIGPNEFFVVYRNGDSSFFMNNVADDAINLFDNFDVLTDQYSYTLSQVIENKSIARYSDGSVTWFDPIPSPLTNNILEDWQLTQPEISYIKTNQKLSFEVKNIEKYTQIEYELTYNSDSGNQGIVGSGDLNNQTSYKKDEILFGTCSSGGTCIYHTNLTNILLKIILKSDSEIKNLEKIIE